MSLAIASLEEAYEILAEFEADALVNHKPRLVDHAFPAQAKFIQDTHFRKAAQCTRRAGKSNGVGRCLFKEAFDFPGCSVLYLALTRRSAENIMWKDVIKRINRDLRLGGEPNETKLMFKLPNESQILLAGADASHEEMEKYLGGAYRCVVIDEAGSFRQDLRKLVYENLEPAVADYEGWVGLIGTPTEITSGLFYDVTNGVEKGWNVHRWQTTDNPYMREKWLRRIALLRETNPRIIETPAFRRMYLNEWVIDNDSLCYKYKFGLNDIESLPPKLENDLVNVLSIDLGFNDSSAFVISSFTEYTRNLWFREPYKRPGMIISDVAVMIQYYIDKYKPIACVVDNASKQAVEELKQRFKLPLEAADKTGKSQFIEIMNADFIQGHIQLVGSECEPMRKEYGALVWDADAKPKFIEHPGCENHLCFVAGTMIRTPDGETPIESLRIGDFVETRKGPRRIEATISRKTKVIKLQISDGSSITCTPDHPFWSNGKWIAAQNLTMTDQLLSWNQLKNPNESFSTEFLTIDHYKQNIFGRVSKISLIDFIKKFGNSIMEKFQKGFTFITRITTLLITRFQTLNVFQQNYISQNILQVYQDEQALQKILSSWKESDLLPRNGIDQKRDVNGIHNTEKKLLRSLMQIALGAKQLIQNLIWQKIKTDVVQQNALQQRGVQAESMTRNENAHGVGRITKPINTQDLKPALLHVLNIIDITEEKRVFNITVEEEHEYFANGFLVKNCDAALYGWRKCYPYLSHAKAPEKSDQEKIDQWFEDKADEHDEKPFWER